MMLSIARPVLIGVTLAAAMALPASQPEAQDGGSATYRNERHGFSITYPAAQFVALPTATENGHQFVSKDGNARLLVGTLPNFDNKNLRDYRAFVLTESFPGAKIDYAPVRDRWFVVSGTRNGMVFYQRVNFACGGRAINSWAMLYPEKQKAIYDLIVEQVHRNYRLGDGNCNRQTTSAEGRTP